jgi:hypothetical protein
VTTTEWETFLQAAKEIEKDYSQEIEKNKKLNKEYKQLKESYDQLQQRYLEVSKQLQEVRFETNGKQSSKNFQKKILEFQKEIEKLRSVYPLLDLLEAKQAEVKRMKKAMEDIPREHPERKAIEAMVKAHIVERDELNVLVEKAEERFKQQYLKIESEKATKNRSSKSPAEEPLQVPEY